MDNFARGCIIPIRFGNIGLDNIRGHCILFTKKSVLCYYRVGYNFALELVDQ